VKDRVEQITVNFLDKSWMLILEYARCCKIEHSINCLQLECSIIGYSRVAELEMQGFQSSILCETESLMCFRFHLIASSRKVSRPSWVPCLKNAERMSDISKCMHIASSIYLFCIARPSEISPIRYTIVKLTCKAQHINKNEAYTRDTGKLKLASQAKDQYMCCMWTKETHERQCQETRH